MTDEEAHMATKKDESSQDQPLVARGQSEGLVPPTDVQTDTTLIEEAQGQPAPKRKTIEVGAARLPEIGEINEDWDVAEADKREHVESKWAGSRVFDVPNEVKDSRPLTVSVAPDFKGTVVKTETGFQVIDA